MESLLPAGPWAPDINLEDPLSSKTEVDDELTDYEGSSLSQRSAIGKQVVFNEES